MSNGDSPVVREKEKRGRNERASSCTPKIYVATGTPTASGESDYATPAPIPRKSLSISSDNLVSLQRYANINQPLEFHIAKQILCIKLHLMNTRSSLLS